LTERESDTRDFGFKLSGRKDFNAPHDKSMSMQERIYQFLLQKIIDGDLNPGDAIPTEAELQSLFDVSRSPARLAVERLRLEGFVTRNRGVGSFVSDNRPRSPWTRISGFLNYFQLYWDKLKLEVLDVTEATPPEHIKNFFHKTKFNKFLNVKRLRSHEGKPVMLIENWIPAVVTCKELSSAERTNLFYEFLKRNGIFLESAYEVVEPISAEGDVAQFLKVDGGTPTLLIKRRVFDKTNRPFMFSMTFVPAGTWKYRTDLSV